MTTPAVVFPIGEDRYAVPVAFVREIVVDSNTTPLPTAPHELLGAFNLRGEVIPMFDTAALLGIGSVAASSIVVVVTTSAGPAGLAVGGLPKFVELDVEVGASDLRGTLGVFDVDDDIAVMLDIEGLLVPFATSRNSTAVDALIT